MINVADSGWDFEGSQTYIYYSVDENGEVTNNASLYPFHSLFEVFNEQYFKIKIDSPMGYRGIKLAQTSNLIHLKRFWYSPLGHEAIFELEQASQFSEVVLFPTRYTSQLTVSLWRYNT